jgi:hypothetical protein
MSNPQEIGQTVQDQTLDAVRMTQDAVVEAVTAWTETANKVTEQLPDFATGYEFPGFAEFTKQFPTAVEVIDFNFDFAEQILTIQRDFAHRILAATTPKVTTPKATAPEVTTPKALVAPAAPKKRAAAKRTTAPKKLTAVPPADTAE